MNRVTQSLFMAMAVVVCTAPSWAVIQYDQNATSEAIFGSGNVNGSFTTDRANGVEIGLRGKLRFPKENTFNSNGDGTYTFSPGVAPGQSFPVGEWSFEWSINTNYDNSTSWNLDDLTYELSMTSTTGATITGFDPINLSYADHSIGTNATGNGAGVEAADDTEYANLIANNNLAQQSWQPQWIAGGTYDPTIPGAYTITLSAFDGLTQIASSQIVVQTPEPASIALLGLGGAAALVRRRR